MTPDRGPGLSRHAAAAEAIGVESCFAAPYHPWQRGTSENTNGLLRERFPKVRPLDDVTARDVQEVYDKPSHRPRKRLGYRTPFEARYSVALQLL